MSQLFSAPASVFPVTKEVYALKGDMRKRRMLKKFIWEDIRKRRTRCSWDKLLWFLGHVLGVSFISWLTLLDRLSTKAKLQKWKSMPLISCKFCASAARMRSHLLRAKLLLVKYGVTYNLS